MCEMHRIKKGAQQMEPRLSKCKITVLKRLVHQDLVDLVACRGRDRETLVVPVGDLNCPRWRDAPSSSRTRGNRV